MDEFRKIRFIYPPLVLLSALALAIGMDDNRSLIEVVDCLPTSGDHSFLSLALSGGVAVVAAGYVIGSLSIFILRLLSCFLRDGRPYEAAASPRSVVKISRHLGARRFAHPEDHLYPIAAFDHGILSGGMKDWLDRRWQAFNISSHTATGLALAPIINSLLDVHPNHKWLLAWGAALVVFISNAGHAWWDTRRMNDLLAGLSSRRLQRVAKPR